MRKKDKEHFEGRSLTVINDFSTDEQMHIYQKAKELKEADKKRRKDIIELFKIRDNAYGVQTVFLEDSTRTFTSFTNAAQFLDVKLNDFKTDKSALNKKESYKDTFDMLTGYNNNIYVIRSKLEGVCKYLEQTGKKYTKRNDLPIAPAFINAGDGQHEHPTQELLDEFTFLEHNQWDNKNIHLALIGDLKHGRTTHSKADGLKIFEKVEVDLIAPSELAMPKEYRDKMTYNGYQINIFSSLTEYFANPERIAPILYFTRPQLERMGEEILKIQDELRKTITFSHEHCKILEKNGLEKFKIFHPLPRNGEHPEIPGWLDETSLNGWEKQAINGYYIRIALMSAIAGNPHVNDGFTGKINIPKTYTDDFIQHKPIVQKSEEERVVSEGVRPIANGIVIDHIGKGKDAKEIREILNKVATILPSILGHKGGSWISDSQGSEKNKGILFCPDSELDDEDIRKLAGLIPNSTINVIKDKQVIKKMKIKLPPTMKGFPEMHCKNTNCITHPSHIEIIPASFIRKNEDSFICEYCDKEHHHKDIWK